ncbi:hypothetical protein AALP_AA2G092500 [Arabis alpina]|uniref:Rad51-like C-terminal domain-containing protein n=1 Tax=Arabis alpina TaxID=50452 RepID=A0A087HG99_ARAAL|nr:hypothetical protein AALP_AA2G092500 [Arabis alpina]
MESLSIRIVPWCGRRIRRYRSAIHRDQNLSSSVSAHFFQGCIFTPIGFLTKLNNQVIVDPGGGHVLTATIRFMKGKGEHRVGKVVGAPNLLEGEAMSFNITYSFETHLIDFKQFCFTFNCNLNV